MAANLALILPELKDKALELLERCNAKGCEMRPSTGLRDPFEQGRLWRQSRSIEEITKKIDDLNNQGGDFLAHCIASVGPQNGQHATDAPPGLSWHQWGESLDCFWLVDNKAEWSTKRLVNGVNGYRVYTDEAIKVGLYPGGAWDSFKDWPHVQLKDKTKGVLSVMTLKEANDVMKARFG